MMKISIFLSLFSFNLFACEPYYIVTIRKDIFFKDIIVSIAIDKRVYDIAVVGRLFTTGLIENGIVIFGSPPDELIEVEVIKKEIRMCQNKE